MESDLVTLAQAMNQVAVERAKLQSDIDEARMRRAEFGQRANDVWYFETKERIRELNAEYVSLRDRRRELLAEKAEQDRVRKAQRQALHLERVAADAERKARERLERAQRHETQKGTGRKKEWRKQFTAVAYQMLDPELFRAISDEANRRVHDE